MDQSETAKPIRAFVAIAIPQPLIQALREVQQLLQFKTRGELVRWTRPDQLHLTLNFLGDVPATRLEELRAALNLACEGHPVFQIALQHLGSFPNVRNPRVIWIGIGGDHEALCRLQQRIEEATRDFGDHLEERAFQPHLTIGRAKAEPRRANQLEEAIEQTRLGRLGEWTVGEVELMQSELSPQGARYTRLVKAKLA